jgi:hypothetical protein
MHYSNLLGRQETSDVVALAENERPHQGRSLGEILSLSLRQLPDNSIGHVLSWS